MSKLYSSNHIIKTLYREGFSFISQKGSHVKLRKTFGRTNLTVIVPAHKKEIPLGTFRSILRQANLTTGNFKKRKNIT